MKAKTRHFPITDFGGRGGLNVPFNLSKIVACGVNVTTQLFSRISNLVVINNSLSFTCLFIPDIRMFVAFLLSPLFLVQVTCSEAKVGYAI